MGQECGEKGCRLQYSHINTLPFLFGPLLASCTLPVECDELFLDRSTGDKTAPDPDLDPDPDLHSIIKISATRNAGEIEF